MTKTQEIVKLLKRLWNNQPDNFIKRLFRSILK